MIRSALALLALAAAASAQSTLTVTPSDARSVRTVTTGGLHGSPITSTSTLVAGLMSGIDSGDGTGPSATYRWQALFPLSAIPAQATVLSATITTGILTVGANGMISGGLYASAIGTLTTDVPTVTNGYAHIDNTVGVKTIDATDAFRAYRAAGTPYGGLIVSAGRNFGALTWSTPTLTVTYAPVPEPSALAALGLGALALLRRRKA